jgi:hypothetical protein
VRRTRVSRHGMTCRFLLSPTMREGVFRNPYAKNKFRPRNIPLIPLMRARASLVLGGYMKRKKKKVKVEVAVSCCNYRRLHCCSILTKPCPGRPVAGAVTVCGTPAADIDRCIYGG